MFVKSIVDSSAHTHVRTHALARGRLELGAQRGWNQLELLCREGRVRVACNGVMLTDYCDPAMAPGGHARGDGADSPNGDGGHRIALQAPLAQPGKVSEMHYRGLLLAERPEDRMLTVR
eukprot:SAG11_NODE_230_length_11943_cov_73.442962_3_plen_119_part_00